MLKHQNNKNCPFCKAILSENFFCQSNNFVAIYNIAPILPGHCMIIPKNHTQRVLDLSDDRLSEMMIFSRKVIEILNKVFPNDGFNWTIQDGESAGQTVQHVHLHIIPRISKDLAEPGDWYPKLVESKSQESNNRTKLSEEDYLKITKTLKSIN